MPIPAPRRTDAHPDYQLDCEEAMDLEVRDLVDRLIHAGWRPETVFAALASVARHQAMAYAEDPDPAGD